MNAVKRTICLRRLSLAALALSVAWPATAWAHGNYTGAAMLFSWFIVIPCATVSGTLLIVSVVLQGMGNPVGGVYRVAAYVLNGLCLLVVIPLGVVVFLGDRGKPAVIAISVVVYGGAVVTAALSIYLTRKLPKAGGSFL